MNSDPNTALEEQIAQWRGYLRRRRAVDGPDIEELESHLRDQIATLREAGLAADEAFLVAVKRMGNLDELSREFARMHSERLWKQLVLSSGGDEPITGASRSEFPVVLGLAVAAAVAVKIPALFGVGVFGGNEMFYVRNAGLLVLPFLALYFVWKRGASPLIALSLAVPFVVGAVVANLFSFQPGSQTGVLLGLHLPIVLWLAVGFAYFKGRWFGEEKRMDFVRFSGELAIYLALIALGGGVFTAFTVMIFKAIHLDVGRMVGDWILPCGVAGALIIGSWLVEAKQSVIENMAPVLTRIFTPLFTVLLVVFLATMAWTGSPIDVQREVLIGFDLLLVLVVGLVLYAASARDPKAPPDLFDTLQLLLVLSALAVDVLALAAIASRISEFGFTPNRVAALGENLILLANLAGTAWFHFRFMRRRAGFVSLERWQIGFLPAYSIWAAIVVVVFPPAFGFH